MTNPGVRLRAAAVVAAALLGGAAAPACAGGSLITVLDNSHADSILEVDRTANIQAGRGTAGSDHDGSAVDAIQALMGEPRQNDDD
ncbi:hypothetical protein ACWDE0_23935 [Streptomyces sp. 900105755]|uniref:hypothetical protein n=1 Tax=unclassified Streptomyces TaxID=2593676 RepID=UPI000897519F|nr:hypothetical protein [Streptomyces sp. Ag109_O5-10]SEE33271.1 hypothetical protein SAMN05216533_1995 [Streptomyces sp. Ag109_O5-10]